VSAIVSRIRRAPLWLLALLFSPPLLVTLVRRLFDGWWWWRDFDAVLCAGVRAGKGLAIYAAHPACTGLQPADYVYPPQIAWLDAGVVQHVGVAELRALFALLQALVCVWLLWLMFVRPLPNVSRRARIPALGLIDGGIIVCGNLAIACHALVAAALLAFRRSRAPFIAAVALISVMKPTYAAYLVVLLLDEAPWRVRLARTAAGALVLGAVGLLVWRTGGAELGQWLDALHRVVVQGKPGGGLLGLFALLGLPTRGPLPPLAFLACAGLLTLAGLAIVETRQGGGAPRFSAEERWLFGLGLVQLINPRPLGYDFLVMAPLVAMTGLAAREVSDRFAALAQGWMVACCLLFWGMVNVFMGGQASEATTPALSLGVLAVGLTLGWRRLSAGRAGQPERSAAAA
jgi:hypothetical protein